MNRDKARVAVYAMGGFYLLYLAWQMYWELSTAGSEKPLMIGFMIFFTIIGAGLAGWGLYSGWKTARDRMAASEPEEASENPEDKSDENKLE